MQYDLSGPAVTVVLPVYNSGERVKKCLASLQNQTLRNIEIIFVDDLGKDQSMDIIRKAAQEDERIIILTNPENMGSGKSRNRGIEAARGAYVSFVDSDDYVNERFLESLWTKAQQSNADIVKGIRQNVREGEGADLSGSAASARFNQKIRQQMEKGKPLYLLFCYEHQTAIYRREMLMRSGARYGTSYNGQDTTFLLRACYAAKTIEFADDAVYSYVINENSRTGDFSKFRLEQELISLEEKLDFWAGHPSEDRLYIDCVCDRFQIAMKLHAVLRSRTQEAHEWFVEEVQKKLLAFPFSEALQKSQAVLCILARYGVSLCKSPFSSWQIKPEPDDYVDTVRQWVNFLKKYPKEAHSVRMILSKVVAETLNAIADGNVLGSARRHALKQLHQLVRTLPDVSVLLGTNRCLDGFVKYGADVFVALRWVQLHMRTGSKRNGPTLDDRTEGAMKRFLSEPAVSVVLATYNPGVFLRRCLHTLRRQTLRNIEIIFVDDCGTDHSMQQIRLASWIDRRIRILKNKKNMGAGASRNNGLDVARGEYVCFFDPDDDCDERALELLWNKAQETGADIVKGVRYRINEKDELISEKTSELNDVIRERLEEGRPLRYVFTYEHNCAIFRRDMIVQSGARYGNGNNSEDTTFLLRACSAAKSFEIVDEAKFYYRIRTASRTNDMSAYRLEQELLSVKDKLDFLQQKFPDDPDALPYICNRFYILMRLHTAISTRTQEKNEWFAKALQSMLTEHPLSAQLQEKNVCLQILAKYGIILIKAPAYPVRIQKEPGDYVEMIRRWVDFLCECPDDTLPYRRAFRQILAQTLRAKTIANAPGEEKKQVLGQLYQQAKRFPNPDEFYRRDRITTAFMKHGKLFAPRQSDLVVKRRRKVKPIPDCHTGKSNSSENQRPEIGAQ